MRKKNHIIVLFMLFVFGVLTLKTVIVGAGDHGSCDEFGHLHIQNVWSLIQGQHHHSEISSKTNNHLDCHEGKSLAGYSLQPQASLDFAAQIYQVSFAVIFKIDHHFKSPDLEPHRRPPKQS